MALQHLRSSTANKRPLPGSMSDGQLAVNTEATSPGLFFKNASGSLVKVGPVHVGTTAPNASPASGGETGNTLGEQWLDTTGGTYVFKVWDGSAWRSETGTFVDVNGDTMTGALGIIAGSAGSPGLFVSGDPNTGIYSPGADQVAVATGGVQRINIEADGDINIDGGGVFYDATNNQLGIGTTSASSLLHLSASANPQLTITDQQTANTSGYVRHANGTLIIDSQYNNSSGIIAFTRNNNASESARIDTSGRLLVGTSSAYTIGASSGWAFQAATAGIAAIRPSNDINPCVFTLAKTRSTSLGSYAIVQNNDNIGEINFAADDGADYATLAAAIRCQVDGTPNANEMPGRLVFATTPTGVGASAMERMRIDSRGNLFIGTGTSASSTIWANANTVYPNGYIGSNGSFGMDIVGNGYRNTSSGWTSLNINGQTGRTIISLRPEGNIIFGADALSTGTSPTERMKIDSSGNVLVGTTSGINPASSTDVGFDLNPAASLILYRSGAPSLTVGRQTNDGELVSFYQAGTKEGTISVSGTTVSYNGAHLSRWSQLSGIDPHDKDARPEILRGTVMSNLDEMCDWIDPESGEPQANEQLNKTKISDVEGDKNVAGVFQGWDDDDDTWVNDFYLAMTGDFVIRIAEGVTVERGDLLTSAGDGTAKPQDDDLIRSSTVAKVTSTTVSHVHPDGSYCIPCVLMAC